MSTAFERFRSPAVAPRGGAASRWDVVYAKDLRAMVSETFYATDSNDEKTLTASDGTQWSLHVASGSGAFVAGVGAVLTAKGTQLPQYQNAYAALRFVILCPSIPGWNANRDTAVQVRFAGTVANNTEVGATAYTSGPGWGYGPGNNNSTVRLRFPGEAATGADVNWADIGNVSQVSARFAVVDIGNLNTWALAQVVRGVDNNHRGGLYLRGADPLVFPVIEDMHPVGGTSDGTVSTPLKVGFYLGSTAAEDASYTATDIRVLQKDRA